MCTTPPGLTLNSTVFVDGEEAPAGINAAVNVKTSRKATWKAHKLFWVAISSCLDWSGVSLWVALPWLPGTPSTVDDVISYVTCETKEKEIGLKKKLNTNEKEELKKKLLADITYRSTVLNIDA